MCKFQESEVILRIVFINDVQTNKNKKKQSVIVEKHYANYKTTK